MGAGSPDEQYRARDMKLGREVAFRVLPVALARDAAGMARFARAVQTLASLNHPQIPAIYELGEAGGVPSLVTELVEGPTLAERLAGGPVTVPVALAIGSQIASALEAAHDRGIVHGDLEPLHVKITPAGNVKLLDFGVGQAMNEQADKRDDVWAFGAVLYQMLTGKGLPEEASGTPDWNALPPTTPTVLRHILERTLEPDRKRRLRDISEARVAMEDAGREGAAPRHQLTIPGSARPWMILSAVLAAVTGLTLWRGASSEPPPAPSAVAFTVALTTDAIAMGDAPGLAFSSDGKTLVYEAGGRLYLRYVDRVDAVPIAGTEGATGPFLSPDGRTVGFAAEGRLKRVNVGGGAAKVICEAPSARGASWGDDDRIVFAPAVDSGLFRVEATGGTPEKFTTLDTAKGEITHRWPQVLPGAKALIYTAATGQNANDYDNAEIVAETTPGREAASAGAGWADGAVQLRLPVLSAGHGAVCGCF